MLVCVTASKVLVILTADKKIQVTEKVKRTK
jgi:hypothetical protein